MEKRIDAEEYRSALIQCWMLANLSENIPTGEMLSRIAAADTIGPMIDPTLWMEKHKAMKEDKKIIEAIATLQSAFLKLKAAHPELVAARLA